MKAELLDEVIACLPKGKTHYRYFKGAYAPRLLSLLIDGEAPIRALKSSGLKNLTNHPLVKTVAAKNGDGVISAQDLSAVWQEPSQPFLLSVSRWGGRSNRRWFQTSRFGENLVLQLNLPMEHQRRYKAYVDGTGTDTLNGPTSNHPVQRPLNNPNFRETLAWARIDLDFVSNEALIEEIQSDGARYVMWWERRYQRCGCVRCKRRLKYTRWMQAYRAIWAEAMMMAAISFIKDELGIDRVFYHTDRSGWKVKKMEQEWRAPKSLYSDLPKKFAFKRTWAAPEFLLATKSYQQLIRKQPDIDFYQLSINELQREQNNA